MRFSSLLCALPLLLLGCSAKDAVSLSVQLEQPVVKVKAGALGGSVSGSFRIDFKLGSEASGSTTVSASNFALQSASGAVLVPILAVDSQQGFPLVIDKGQSKSVTVTLTGSQVDHDAACAGQVQIIGSVSDTLKDGSDPLRSGLITADCS
jgi:hypothetical protein